MNSNLFIASTSPICGNGIVEGNEECDCGYECNDRCCIAPGPVDQCKRANVTFQCSPSQGSCCDSSSCLFSAVNTTCQSSEGCLEDIKCSGSSATCPSTNSKFFKPDNSTCNSGTQICTNGTCGGSICSRFGLTECYLGSDDPTENCHLACNGSNL